MTRKITPNISATHWAPSATSLNPRGATIVGHWPTAGYHFEASKGLADDDHFVGLAIDEDRQPELTAERVEKWVKQISEELHLDEILNA
ncbi:flavodoxin 1 [Escherichia coli]|uniref:Flavodoxin 1 n=1 Tax=Escherichia coli TaxID=562 RepID=A0A2X1KIH1_ECOLX|nr:flavodoxin 1 [Escherichia coli]